MKVACEDFVHKKCDYSACPMAMPHHHHGDPCINYMCTKDKDSLKSCIDINSNTSNAESIW